MIGHTLPKDEVTYMLLNNFPSSYGHLVVSMRDSNAVQVLDKLMAILEHEEQRQIYKGKNLLLMNIFSYSIQVSDMIMLRIGMINFRKLHKRDGKEISVLFDQWIHLKWYVIIAKKRDALHVGVLRR